MIKKLYVSLILCKLVVLNLLITNHRMHNLYAIFAKFLEICKRFSKNLVNEHGNISRRGVVPRFSDLEVVALNLTAEALSIDSENYLFHKLAEYRSSFTNLISRRQYNDRKKTTASLCESIRKNVAMEMDGSEDMFCIDSKPIEVCRIARAKRCKMGRKYETSPFFCKRERKARRLSEEPLPFLFKVGREEALAQPLADFLFGEEAAAGEFG